MDISAGLFCLALNIYNESRNDPLNGQLAVALVTLNRAHRQKEKICKVVFENNQFSWTNLPNWAPKDKKAWQRSIKYAKMSFKIQDFTCGATHFHAWYVYPKWASNLTFINRFGSHLFYKKGAVKCPYAAQ